MGTRGRAFFDWLHARTGFRTGLRVVLDEPLPSGVNWWFTLGSILLFLLVVQFLTGVVLMMYYVPTPDHAYDSVRFIATEVALGRVVRGLHFFGASFMVVAAGLHVLRVLFFGAYKAPRELTWITGVVLLLLVLAFALSGYLLPWDQRAYWATVVTVNIARSSPVIGDWLAAVLRGGPELGALTLTRWYAAHVILLPGALALFVLLHLFLMRRHGIAGPARRREGPARPFYPDHAIKDTIAIAAVFLALLAFASFGDTPLDEMADPADATYTPRPEWYFLGLFQLLKYFPGRLEPVATIGIPGALVALLILLPFLDRRPERHASARPVVLAIAAAVVLAIVVLTTLGLKDSPALADINHWGPRAIAGRALAASPGCVRCHTAGGAAPAFAAAWITRDDEWIVAHVSDPEAIAPGLRPPPPEGLELLRARAVAAYARKLRAGARPPETSPEEETASFVFATHCVACHQIDGDGGDEGPNLTHIGRERDAVWLARWIANPPAVDPDTDMPAFGDKLTAGELHAIAAYLAKRR